jgi:isopenicillin N synthase-like dioxygenase
LALKNEQSCSTLMDALLHCVSVALKLPEAESILQYHSGIMNTASLIRYPPVPAAMFDPLDTTRMPAHIDFGTLTLLFQQHVGGLEVEVKSFTGESKFVPVEPDPQTVLVLGGHMLDRWTNRQYTGCRHRVTAPSLNSEGCEERYSIVFFSIPNEDTVIEPLSTCAAGRQAFKSIKAGDYLRRKRQSLYA